MGKQLQKKKIKKLKNNKKLFFHILNKSFECKNYYHYLYCKFFLKVRIYYLKLSKTIIHENLQHKFKNTKKRAVYFWLTYIT